MEQLLEGNLIHRLSGSIQPIEIAKKLARDMEANRSVSKDRVTVHNVYQVHLHPDDFQEYEGQQRSIERELAAYLVDNARERRLSSAGPIRVHLIEDLETPRHQVRIGARTEDHSATVVGQQAAASGFTARLRLPEIVAPARSAPTRGTIMLMGQAGERPVVLDRFPFTLGRGLENDLILDDKRVSRYHAQLREIQGRLSVLDLESTNGTFVNGERVRERVLHDGDRVSLGGVELLVRLS